MKIRWKVLLGLTLAAVVQAQFIECTYTNAYGIWSCETTTNYTPVSIWGFSGSGAVAIPPSVSFISSYDAYGQAIHTNLPVSNVGDYTFANIALL